MIRCSSRDVPPAFVTPVAAMLDRSRRDFPQAFVTP